MTTQKMYREQERRSHASLACYIHKFKANASSCRQAYQFQARMAESTGMSFLDQGVIQADLLDLYAQWQWGQQEFHTKVFDYLHLWDMTQLQRSQMEAMFGRGRRGKITPQASNAHTWKAVMTAAVQLLLMRRQNQPQPYYFITMIDERWHTSDREAAVNLKFMSNRGYQALREVGLHGFAMCELQAITNYGRKGKGRLITPHLHIIAWSGSGAVDRDAVVARIGGRFKGSFGAPGLKIEEIGDTHLDMARVVQYMAKPPFSGKRCVKGREGRPIDFESVIEGYRPDLCLRVAEILSHITVQNMIFGCGEGAGLRRQVFKALKEYEARYPARIDEILYPEKVWKGVRARNSKYASYSTPVVHV